MLTYCWKFSTNFFVYHVLGNVVGYVWRQKERLTADVLAYHQVTTYHVAMSDRNCSWRLYFLLTTDHHGRAVGYSASVALALHLTFQFEVLLDVSRYTLAHPGMKLRPDNHHINGVKNEESPLKEDYK